MSAKGRVALGNLCELPMIGAKPVDIVLEQVFFFLSRLSIGGDESSRSRVFLRVDSFKGDLCFSQEKEALQGEDMRACIRPP